MQKLLNLCVHNILSCCPKQVTQLSLGPGSGMKTTKKENIVANFANALSYGYFKGSLNK